ncbi:MAG: gliding motility-associated C-terminal domain-containing protein, partial [Bacteroidota bacterium]|nr:gliding motility-associated C-terminal domain-containing protein [Bacteroidota bacterium]
VLTDSNSCQYSDSFLITQPLPLSVIHDSTNISCNGGNDGSITLTVSGGTTPYNYYWTSNDSTANLSGLQSGMYGVTVTDSNNCQRLDSVFLSEPLLLMFTDSIKPIYCYGDNSGIISLSPQGGTLPYQFNWSDGPMSSTRDSLVPGIYKVVLTDSNSCQYSDSFLITQPLPLSVIHDSTNISCNGGNDGSITLTVSGGTTPYNYYWTSNDSTANLSGLQSGMYGVTVTDSNNCQRLDSVFLSEPLLLMFTDSIKPIYCYGDNSGIISLSPQGGTLPYQFNWSDGPMSSTRDSLVPGIYKVVLTDSNSCQYSDSFLITQPLPLSVIHDSTNISCNGGNDGSITLTVSGGTLPYQFNWSDGPTSSTRNNLVPGIYKVVVTDSNSCQYSDSFLITQPLAGQIIFNTQNIKCFNDSSGSIILSFSGGTTPYLYSWSSGQTTKDITNVPSGKYIITVTDSNNCLYQDSVQLFEPSPIISSGTIDSLTCYGSSDGHISISVSGGISPYTFLWNTSNTTSAISGLKEGNYFVLIKDSNQCQYKDTFAVYQPDSLMITSQLNHVKCFGDSSGSIDLSVFGGTKPYQFVWSNNLNNEDIFNLVSALYSVQIVDKNGCFRKDTFIIEQPADIQIFATTKNVCKGLDDGWINTTVIGGSLLYSYNWSTGQKTEDIQNLQAGIYILQVTDSNGCTQKDTFEIFENLDTMQIHSNIHHISCYRYQNGNINLSISGGTNPFQYFWSNGKNTQDIDSLDIGTYTIKIIDSIRCEAFDTFIITEPDKLKTIMQGTDVSCFEFADGSASVINSGGTTPYSYNWSNGEQTQQINNLDTGIYYVTVTDSNACQIEDTLRITQPPELLISSKVNNILCHGQQNGYINLTLSGGIPSFILTWSNGKTGTYLNNLSAGTYNVIIEQANNCLNYDTFEIIEPDSLYLNYNKINEGCKGDKNGSIDVEVFGGIKPYQYIWNNNSKKEDINGLEVGAFLIVVTDSNGCTINSDSIHITAYPLPKPIILPDNNVTICNDSFAIFKIQQNYIVYDWNTGQSTQSITVNEDGEFFAIVTDINGCKGKSETRYLTVLDPTTFVDLKPEYIFCPDDGPLTLAPKVSMNGDFLWEPTGETTKNIVVDEEGIYIVHLDVNGCVSSDSTFIKEICPPVVQVPSAFTPNGDGLNDVFQLFTLYVDTLYYIIFDRWGEIIFRGYSKNDTWDGCYKNDLVEVETYAYLLWYYNELVGWRNKNGRITIIR